MTCCSWKLCCKRCADSNLENGAELDDDVDEEDVAENQTNNINGPNLLPTPTIQTVDAPERSTVA